MFLLLIIRLLKQKMIQEIIEMIKYLKKQNKIKNFFKFGNYKIKNV